MLKYAFLFYGIMQRTLGMIMCQERKRQKKGVLCLIISIDLLIGNTGVKLY